MAVVEMLEEDDGLDAPIFFLSYAHPPESRAAPETRPYAVELFDLLCQHVGELIGSPTGGESGFMDRSMGDGRRWREEVLATAGTCHVFVALLSVPYLKSPWCAREWDAFSRRRVSKKDGRPVGSGTAILPVTWMPGIGRTIPASIGAVQRFSPREVAAPEIERSYDREGVYGLYEMREQAAYKGAFQTVAWRLARSIVDKYDTYEVKPQIPRFDELRSDFGGGEG